MAAPEAQGCISCYPRWRIFAVLPAQLNAANGTTIDLSGLNAIDVASNEVAAPSGTGTVSNGTYDGDFAVNETSANIVSGGSGSTWCDVYNVLQPKNLIAVGGRGAGLGVGGLTTSLQSPCFTVFQNVRAE